MIHFMLASAAPSKQNRGMNPLRLVRSILFLPASNPRAIAKARGLAADLVVLDLEDSVKPTDKDSARAAAVAAVAERFGGLAAIRINSRSPWYEADLEAVAGCAADYLVYPMTSDTEQIRRVAERSGKPVMAMIETARGVLAAPAIAEASAALIAGTNDLAADLGLILGSARPALTTALQTIVLAARASGIAAFDGVYNRLDDLEGLAAECREGRGFGFDGKSLIHPSQIEPANRAFGPTAEEVDAAQRLIAAATGGAERYGDEMIEQMHVDQARFVLARAR
jgi:(3S)-malyl-CoA thioesterase